MKLERAALCVEDDTVFEIGSACPTCGADQWVSLARVLGDPESRRGVVTGELASVSSRPVAAPPGASLPLSTRDGSSSTLPGNPAAIRRLTDGALAAFAALCTPDMTFADLLMAGHNVHGTAIESVVATLAPTDPDVAALIRRSALRTFVAWLEERIDHGQH